MKITDIEPYDGMLAPLGHIYLEFVGSNESNVSGKSNKFWEAAIFQEGGVYTLVRRWGKFGAKGQIKRQEFHAEWAAENALWDVAQKKRDKGYTREIDVISRLGTLVDDA